MDVLAWTGISRFSPIENGPSRVWTQDEDASIEGVQTPYLQVLRPKKVSVPDLHELLVRVTQNDLLKHGESDMKTSISPAADQIRCQSYVPA